MMQHSKELNAEKIPKAMSASFLKVAHSRDDDMTARNVFVTAQVTVKEQKAPTTKRILLLPSDPLFCNATMATAKARIGIC